MPLCSLPRVVFTGTVIIRMITIARQSNIMMLQGWIMANILETWIMMKTANLRGFVHGRLAEMILKRREPDLRPAPSVTGFIRLHPGALKGGETSRGWQMVNAAGKAPMQTLFHNR